MEQSRGLDRTWAQALFATRECFPQVRSFVPDILETLHFESPDADNALLPIGILRRMGSCTVARCAPRGAEWLHSSSVGIGGDGAGPDGSASVGTVFAGGGARCPASGRGDLAGGRRYTAWDAGLYNSKAWPSRRASFLSESGLGEGAPTSAG